MSFSSLPATLTPALGGREAVADALYRFAVGLDTNDKALFESAFVTDAVFVLDGTVMDGLDAINTNCFGSISKLDTTHFLTNQRINISDENSKAELTCSALAQHYRGGESKKVDATSLLVGSSYRAHLVKTTEDGLWKMKRLELKIVWSQGDWGVFSN
ncbi:LAFA_0F22672g1_1 [Lachancea sp. 'fantastica']|nr:LAFA_0F22672g1_1 [Lachancea sp. 'fantastica']